MSNVTICVGQSFDVKNFCLSESCLTSIFDPSNLKVKIQHAKNVFQFARFDNLYKKWTDMPLLYCCTLHVFFSQKWPVPPQWRPRADRSLNLDIPVVGSTCQAWTLAKGKD